MTVKCHCMGDTDATREAAIEQVAARIELGIHTYATGACPEMIATAAARVAGSIAAQCGNIEGMKAELLRQIDVGAAYAAKIMSEMAGANVSH